jgi:hypothetical protein
MRKSGNLEINFEIRNPGQIHEIGDRFIRRRYWSVGRLDMICFCVSNIVRMMLHFSFGTPKLERHLFQYVFSIWM